MDQGNDRVQHFDFAGVVQNAIGGTGSAPGQFQAPTGIAMAPIQGWLTFLVADTDNHRVQRFDKYGNLQQTLGSAQAPNGHLTQPMGIAYTQKDGGLLYVADFGNDRIQVFDVEGAFLTGWQVGGEPVDVAIDPSEFHVWVVTLGGLVERYELDGTFVAAWAPPFGQNPGEIGDPKAIAVDAQQHVYIANQWSGGAGNTNMGESPDSGLQH